MPTQFHFKSKQPGIDQSNAENFCRANMKIHDNVRRSGQNVVIGDSEIDIIRCLCEFKILESADSVEFHIWDNSRSDVIIQTNHRIPEEPLPISRDRLQKHDLTKDWLDALRSDRLKDRKKVLQAISQHPNDFPERVDILVPTLIDALKEVRLTLDAKKALENIAHQRPHAVQSYIDQITPIQNNDTPLISMNASEIAEQIKKTKMGKYTCSSEKEEQTKNELVREDSVGGEKSDVDRNSKQEDQDSSLSETHEDPKTVSESITSLGDQTADSKSLREKAEEDAVEKTSGEKANTTYQTTRYTSSDTIKEYVKDRADGVCEGCEETAPFTSKTGEPYLHAHHVHELGKGGSDTPETVIALCPNCHYRIHHGEDGEEYNQELIERLAVIEDLSVDSIRSKNM